ncbi:MAG: hypothetical protein IJ175_00265 [Clostridia bacterium]|nr:hypothetical protein [Clostridia bacterium]
MKKRIIRVIALGLLVLTVPALAFAAETAPWSLAAQPKARREDLGRIGLFCHERGAGEISASDKWLWQGRINGVLINMRLFAPDGSGTLFQEQLEVMTPGTSDLRLYLRQRTDQGGLMLQTDARALQVLKNCGIREILLADKDYYLQNTFQVEELFALRRALGLEDGEQLCVGGEDDPVMIVSETGRRRYATE